MAFAHWIREDVALDFQFLATDLDVVTVEGVPFESTETRGSFGLLFGARYYFPKATFGGTSVPTSPPRCGPFSEYYVYSDLYRTEVRNNSTRFGGQLGGGVDFQLSRLFSLGVRLGVTFRDGYDPSSARRSASASPGAGCVTPTCTLRATSGASRATRSCRGTRSSVG